MSISKSPWTTTHGWIYDADGELVGICWGKTLEEAERNAQIASAAPDMLAMLEELQECAAYWSEYDVPLGIVDRLAAAIRRATGGGL